MNDQPFWADRLVKLGVSPGAVRFQKVSAGQLGSLIQDALSQPSYRQVAELGKRIRAEDGAGRIVAAVQQIATGMASRALRGDAVQPAAPRTQA